MSAPTDEEFEAIVSTWEPELAEVVRSQRRELTKQGITREPMRTRMACEFAEVIIASRRKQESGMPDALRCPECSRLLTSPELVGVGELVAGIDCGPVHVVRFVGKSLILRPDGSAAWSQE